MEPKVLVVGGSIIAVVALIVLYQVRKDAIAIGGAAVAGAKTAAHAVSPINHNNIFSTAVNSVGSAVSADSNWTLGSWFYDVTHPATTKP